ncbi:unnamed protein product, partial [Prorocentrum cordatum]
VRDWPETPDGLRLRVREYRSSGGTEYFVSVEGSNRGLGGGATQRALGGGQKATKKERRGKKQAHQGQRAEMVEGFRAALASEGLSREERKAAAERALAERARDEAELARAADSAAPADEDADNATLYGLLRLRFNDDA